MPTLQNHGEIIYYYLLNYKYNLQKRLPICYKAPSDFSKSEIDETLKTKFLPFLKGVVIQIPVISTIIADGNRYLIKSSLCLIADSQRAKQVQSIFLSFFFKVKFL